MIDHLLFATYAKNDVKFTIKVKAKASGWPSQPERTFRLAILVYCVFERDEQFRYTLHFIQHHMLWQSANKINRVALCCCQDVFSSIRKIEAP